MKTQSNELRPKRSFPQITNEKIHAIDVHSFAKNQIWGVTAWEYEFEVIGFVIKDDWNVELWIGFGEIVQEVALNIV